MKQNGRIILIIAALILVVGGFFGFRYYQKYFGNNVAKEGFVLIPHTANFESILDSISPFLKDREEFAEVAKSKNMDRFFKAGRYRIEDGTGNTDLVNMIKAGNQTENSFRIGDFFTVYQMIGKVTKKNRARFTEICQRFK